LDLDLLTYDDLTIAEADLTVPHPRLHERAFVLVPLACIDPAFEPALCALAPSERAEVVPLEEGKRSSPCPGASVLSEKGERMEWTEVTRRVREVAAACAAGGLCRLSVDDADVHVAVRRSAAIAARAEAAPKPAPEVADVSPSRNGVVEREQEAVVLRSGVVGIVRMSHPSVAEGTLLGEERELASVESLGIRNPVASGGTGRIVRVFVTEGQPVEYGQPLFAIERS
jgi:biotin carboxyl carrier protein